MPAKKWFGGPRAINATSTNSSGQPPVARAGLGSQAAQNIRRIPRVVTRRGRLK